MRSIYEIDPSWDIPSVIFPVDMGTYATNPDTRFRLHGLLLSFNGSLTTWIPTPFNPFVGRGLSFKEGWGELKVHRQVSVYNPSLVYFCLHKGL
jgi:hypothetical protein